MTTENPGFTTQGRALARSFSIVLAGVTLLTLAAKTQIPFWPVPMTLHTMAVMGLAVTLGPRLATLTFLTYLAAGASGLPVFSGSPERGIGLAYIAGPTGGYLAGYLVACWLTGTLSAGRGFIGRTAAMLAGLAVTYLLGLAWLSLYLPANTLLTAGFLTFLPGDLAKIGVVALGTLLVPALRKPLKETE